MTANLNSESYNSLETEEELLNSLDSEAEPASFHRETFLYHSIHDAPAEPDFASDESGVGTIETESECFETKLIPYRPPNKWLNYAVFGFCL